MTEYEDLISSGDTWTLIESNSANPSEIDLVQWMISGRGAYYIQDVSQGMHHFFYVRICTFDSKSAIAQFLAWHTSTAHFLIACAN